MTEKVSTLEVRQKLGDMLNRVALRHDQFIIERKGKLLAALIPIERLEQMQRVARLHILVYVHGVDCYSNPRKMGTFSLAVCYVREFFRPNTVQTACSMTTDFSRPCVFLGFFASFLALGYQYFVSPPRERPHILSVLEQQPGDLSQNEVDQIANEAKHQPLRRPRL